MFLWGNQEVVVVNNWYLSEETCMDLCLFLCYFTFVACSVLLLLVLLLGSVKSGSNINQREIATKWRLCPYRPGYKIMNIMQNLMERLRPLVGLKSWDYCVVWKLSEDQRYIEWMDCCCGGTEEVQNGGGELQFPVSILVPCKDVMFQHPRTKSCQLLSQLPSSMPLDSGNVHAQTLMSNVPRWLNFSSRSNSSVIEETIGTRALIPIPIPIPGGLVELFVTKQVTEDQSVIDYVTSQCNLLIMDQEAMINQTNRETRFSIDIDITEHQSKPAFVSEQKDHINNHFSPATTIDNSTTFPFDISLDRIHLSNSSVNGVENGVQDMDADALHKSLMANIDNMHVQYVEANREQQGNDKDSVKQENGRSDSHSDCSDINQLEDDDEDDSKYSRRSGKGPQAKNLHAERRRRKRLNERLYDLRALVPKISKLDKASILVDAISFVKELQKQAKELQNELEQHTDDEGDHRSHNHNNVKSEILNQIVGSGSQVLNGFHVEKSNQDMEVSPDKGQQMEPQVEVAQFDGNELFVKVFSEHKPGGFVRLMEALDSLGLEVKNVSVTSFRSLVSNVFTLEKKDETMQEDYVRDSLLEVTRNRPREWPEMAGSLEECAATDHHHHHHNQHNLHNGHINSNHHHFHHLHS